MIRNRFLFAFLVFVFSIALASSAGCCFYSSSGICSMNTLQSDCIAGGGEWSGSASCSLSECDLGCCVLGSATMFTTQRMCELESRADGFQIQWQAGGSASSCSLLSEEKDMGACTYGEYSDVCTFIERSRCSGTFHLDKLCTDSSLNTSCTKTTKTKCFEDDGVYYLDDCGNRDALKEQCNYDAGSTCRQKSSSEAYCKDLNCVDKFGNARINGESWCIGLDGKVVVKNIFDESVKKTEDSPTSVGSRYFKQSCIDGEIVIEPCADFRNEVCVQGKINKTDSISLPQARCVANPWQDCLIAGNNSEDCDERYCWMFTPYNCVNDLSGGFGFEKLCGDEISTYSEKWPGLSKSQIGESSSDLMADLGLSICLPKIPGGSDISRGTFSEEEGVCSAGNYEAVSKFMQGTQSKRISITGISKIKLRDWRAYSDVDGEWGKIGLISLEEKVWGYGDYQNIFCLEGNPLYAKGNEKMSWSRFSTWADIILGGIVTSPLHTAVYLKDIYGYKIDWEFPPTVSVDYWHCGKIEKAREWPVDTVVVEKLNERVAGIGDCAGKENWLGAGGSSSNFGDKLICGGSGGSRECSFSFETKDFAPPSTGDCSKCGADGLPCSEYRCSAIGKKCEYNEPRGIDSGVCISSDDFNPPAISSNQTPSNPIPPFSSVLITLTTSEDSYCKFDFSSSGGTIDGLRYETDLKFGREHKFVLNLPGRAIYNEDIEEYPLLTRDGRYEIFVRCEDGAGNYNTNPYILNLVVADTPDGVEPDILEFFPTTNSFIKFNTTTKQIEFRLNEPAECRWSFIDEEYEEMGESTIYGETAYNTNQFSCDDLSEQGAAEGYFCSGTLTNVTTEIGESTKYYIRCKDQPMLEGNETDLYKRNANQRSFEYILKPSLALEIYEVYPPYGDFIVGGAVGNLTYTAKTKDGAGRGKAQCKWRLILGDDRTSWQLFSKTNSSSHETLLTTLRNEEYFIDVMCEDSAGNKANVSSQLNILADTSPPLPTRIYNDRGSVKLTLNEPASCKVATQGGCSSVSENGTSMSSSNGRTEFTTGLVKGTRYFVRCEDDFSNSRCFDILFY